MIDEKSNTNFLILGQGRTGSSLLRTLINSHPDVFCDIEIFNQKYYNKKNPITSAFINLFPYQYVKKIRNHYKDKIFGFKFFLYQHKNSDKLVTKLINNEWKIIHLQRKNVLKQAFSQRIIIQTRQSLRKSETELPTGKYILGNKEIVNTIKSDRKYFNREIELLKDVEHLSIVYEDDLRNQLNWNKTCEKIYHFLEVETVEVKSNLLVIDPRPDSERIINFNEIIEHLNNNGFSDYVDDYYKYL